MQPPAAHVLLSVLLFGVLLCQPELVAAKKKKSGGKEKSNTCTACQRMVSGALFQPRPSAFSFFSDVQPVAHIQFFIGSQLITGVPFCWAASRSAVLKVREDLAPLQDSKIETGRGADRVYKKRFTKVYDVELLHHVEQVRKSLSMIAL